MKKLTTEDFNRIERQNEAKRLFRGLHIVKAVPNISTLMYVHRLREGVKHELAMGKHLSEAQLYKEYLEVQLESINEIIDMEKG